MATMFGVRVVKIPSDPVYADGPIMFLVRKPIVAHICSTTIAVDSSQANHRSWADFFMEVVLTEGRGIMLSRMAVLYAFPMLVYPVQSIGACFIFKRGPIANKDTFNASLDRYLANSPHSGWVVYPEGAWLHGGEDSDGDGDGDDGDRFEGATDENTYAFA